VFAQRPLAGNQLCVVPEVLDLPAQIMHALAREIGFSETTFVTDAGGDRYSMRIFTPGTELPFAGHPTLGTAFVMVSESRVSTPVIQSVAAGEFVVDVDVPSGFARMRQLAPVFGEERGDRRAAVAAAVRLDPGDLHPDLAPQVVSTGIEHFIVPCRDLGAVVRAQPDAAALSHLLQDVGAGGFYLFSMEGEDRATARMFAPDVGVTEDPATGSAAGPLGAYLAERGLLSSGDLTISQGAEVGRPSTLVVEVERDGETWRVLVGGGVFVVGYGRFDLAD